MRRTQIYIDEDLDRELRQLASAERRSAGSVIREAVREYVTAHGNLQRGDEDPILALAGAFSMTEDSAEGHDKYIYGRGEDGVDRRE